MVARREELAAMAERLASAEGIEQSLSSEIAQANERMESLRQQHAALSSEKTETRILLRAARAAGARICARRKRACEENKAALETEWTEARVAHGTD